MKVMMMMVTMMIVIMMMILMVMMIMIMIVAGMTVKIKYIPERPLYELTTNQNDLNSIH